MIPLLLNKYYWILGRLFFSDINRQVESSLSQPFHSLAQKAQHTSLNIFLVDDDADDRDIFSDAISEVVSGFKLELIVNGEKLISLLESSKPKPDIIFLDLNMPLKNGFECLEEIRQNKKLGALPVVIYSTTANPEQVKNTLTRGANMFWQKPSDYNSIKKMLHKILHMPFDNYIPKAKTGHFMLKL